VVATAATGTDRIRRRFNNLILSRPDFQRRSDTASCRHYRALEGPEVQTGQPNENATWNNGIIYHPASRGRFAWTRPLLASAWASRDCLGSCAYVGSFP